MRAESSRLARSAYVTQRPHLLIAALATLATAMLAAGCSSSATAGMGTGGSSSPGPTQTSAAPISSAPASTSAPTAAITAPKLATLPVQPSDLPTGWTSVPSTPSTAGDAAKEAALVACVGGRSTVADHLTRSEKDYQQGNNEISSNAQLMKTQDDVTSDTALLHSPKINSCYEQAARKSAAGALPAGATLDSVKFTVTTGANGGPRNVVAVGRGTLRVTAKGQTITVYEDVIFITGNRIEGEIDFTGLGAPIDSALEQHLTTAVANRIASA